MEPYLQQYCQRHIQEYISWNRNRHKPEKSTTGMLLLSLLRVQGNNILPRWYEETPGLCFDCPEDNSCTSHLNPPAVISIYGWRYQARHYCAYANGLLVLPEGTTFYFTNKTTSHLCNLFGNKLQECVLARSVQALIHLLPILLQVSWKVLV